MRSMTPHRSCARAFARPVKPPLDSYSSNDWMAARGRAWLVRRIRLLLASSQRVMSCGRYIKPMG